MEIIYLLLFLLLGILLGLIWAKKSEINPIEQIKLYLAKIANLLLPGKPFTESTPTVEEELRELVDQASEKGLVEESEREMIHSVFDLGETMVRELMVPRTEMVWVEGEKTLRQGLSLALRSGFTRIPVIGDTIDEIQGIVYVKDLAKRIHEHRDSENQEKISELARKATFVPETKMAADLLRDMQRSQAHLAIVVDEYGGVAGLITIEDIIEEIVGEIADEYDDSNVEIEWVDKNTAKVSPRLHIEEFAKEFKIDLELLQVEGIDSLGGIMAQKLGRVPIAGSQIEIGEWKLVAQRPIGRRHRIGTIYLERIISK